MIKLLLFMRRSKDISIYLKDKYWVVTAEIALHIDKRLNLPLVIL
jgi:hypothetical protein